jgi:hypothetical protein
MTGNLQMGNNKVTGLAVATSSGDALSYGQAATISALTVSGVATFSAGAVSAPAITTTGDTNTGIFFPAADTIAFTEGGVESMRITSAGNVGINTTDPDYGSFGATEKILGITGVATNRARLSLQNTSTGTTGVSGTIAFFNGTTQLAALDVIADGATNSGRYVFNTNNAGSSGERMRITSAGDVGIGIAPPTAKLDVVAGTGTLFRCNNPNVAQLNIGNGGSSINYYDANEQIFRNGAAAERMRIDSSGNVGIGTSSVTGGYKLQINGNLLLGTTANPFIAGTTSLSFYGDNSSATGMTINTSGNLGLGVTPSAWSGYLGFDMSSHAGLGSYLQNITVNSNAYFGGAGWTYKSTLSAGQYLISGNSHQWRIAPSGTAGNAITFTTAMTLDASGNLGIGSTSIATVGAYRVVEINGTSGGYLALEQSGTKYGAIGASSGSLFLEAFGASTPLIFYTNGAERMTIDTSGNLLVGTTSVIASAKQTLQFTTGSNGLAINTPDNIANTDFAVFRANSGTCGTISRVGTTAAVSYITTSDYRLKENVVPMTGALAKVAQLKPVTYDWIDGGSSEGFIAHELQAVCPDAVSGEKDAVNEDGSIKPQGIDTSFLVATLTAAIQELKAEVDALKAQINQ